MERRSAGSESIVLDECGIGESVRFVMMMSEDDFGMLLRMMTRSVNIADGAHVTLQILKTTILYTHIVVEFK